jgi:uncharacterized protein (TIGR03435 family)
MSQDGLKLRATKDCPPAPGQPAAAAEGQRPCGFAGDFDDGFEAYGWTMANLCSLLGRRLQRDVVDSSGLTGAFELLLDLPPTPPPGANDPTPLGTVSGALRKVGLTLEPAKATAETIGIDHFERPSAN